MEKMLSDICLELKNYFDVGRIFNTFFVDEEGVIRFASNNETVSIQEGQYFRIVGSIFNDGVHIYPSDLKPEQAFEGAIWLMAVPSTVISLASDIEAWSIKNEAVNSSNMSPFTSESFGGYSYSKGSSSNGSAMTWQDAFRTKLNMWRKARL